MPLALTTRHKQQKLSTKRSIPQHLLPHQNTITTTNENLFRHHRNNSVYFNQSERKQKSVIETFSSNKTCLAAHKGRAYITRSLSVERSVFPTQVLNKHHASIIAKNCKERNDKKVFKAYVPNEYVTTSEQHEIRDEVLENSHRVQIWPSTSSIIKTLNKELDHLNSGAGKSKDVNFPKVDADSLDNTKTIKATNDSASKSDASRNSHSSRKPITTITNKVNLNIVLSRVLHTKKEASDCGFTDQELEGDGSGEISSDNSNQITPNFCPKPKNTKSTENTQNFSQITSCTRPNISAQQRRALYRNSKLAANLTSNNSNKIRGLNSELQYSQNINSSSLTAKKRSPLVRAMSAPVRGLDEASKNSTSIINTKRKSRRRKQNTRNLSYEKGSCEFLSEKDLNFDSKSKINRKAFARSKSIAPDMVTLVSLISSEGSDSEKEYSSSIANNSHSGSPNRRAPCLKKTGKSVSFQENYPQSFQFASKEYSHMLRRIPIAPRTQCSQSNRPLTAPPSSIYHISQTFCNVVSEPNNESVGKKKSHLENIKDNLHNALSETVSDSQPVEEEYKFPEYVRSLKERECWKMFVKISGKGVSITYDTILRGMLTPTEFRQLQKQREIAEAKALKEAAINDLLEHNSKRSPTTIEKLKESLLKN